MGSFARSICCIQLIVASSSFQKKSAWLKESYALTYMISKNIPKMYLKWTHVFGVLESLLHKIIPQ